MSRHDLRNPNHRIQFSWIVGSQKAARFLRKVRPYIVVKIDEVATALVLQEHIDKYDDFRNQLESALAGEKKPDRDEILAYREGLFQHITALKKRAYPPLTA